MYNKCFLNPWILPFLQHSQHVCWSSPPSRSSRVHMCRDLQREKTDFLDKVNRIILKIILKMIRDHLYLQDWKAFWRRVPYGGKRQIKYNGFMDYLYRTFGLPGGDCLENPQKIWTPIVVFNEIRFFKPDIRGGGLKNPYFYAGRSLWIWSLKSLRCVSLFVMFAYLV